MSRVHVIGVATTAFGRHAGQTHKQLAAAAVDAAIADAGGTACAERIGAIHFGSCSLWAWGQPNVGGTTVLAKLLRAGALPAGVPVTNLEGGCATGAMTVHASRNALLAGDCDVALAVGVDKTFMPHDLAAMKDLFEGALDQLDPSTWRDALEAEALRLGLAYQPHPARITLLDVCSLTAQQHMQRWGTTAAQIAASAAKNHQHGALNPNAQYKVAMTVQDVLADKPIVGALTRAMCAPISDGAAAAVLCSDRALRELPAEIARRAVSLDASALVSGRRRALDAQPISFMAARKAYAAANVAPGDIQVAEVHDATSFGEIAASEALGFCELGEGGRYIESGAAALGGKRPTNLSGGLVSKGHPLAATGLAMLHELVTQLRGEAGDRQAQRARRAVLHNAGGLVTFDEAVCAVQVLSAPR